MENSTTASFEHQYATKRATPSELGAATASRGDTTSTEPKLGGCPTIATTCARSSELPQGTSVCVPISSKPQRIGERCVLADGVIPRSYLLELHLDEIDKGRLSLESGDSPRLPMWPNIPAHQRRKCMIESHPRHVTGYLRLPQVLEIIPVSRSTWYRGIKSGRYPQPVKLGARAAGWKIESVRDCVAELERGSSLPWN